MPTYVALVHWTDQGIKNYKDTTSRAEAFSKLVEGSGGRIRELLSSGYSASTTSS